MNKLTYGILALIVFLLIGIGFTLLSQNGGVSTNENIYGTLPVETDTTISIPTQQEVVVINNFTKNPEVLRDSQNPDYYFLGNTFKVDANDPAPTYVITYDSTSGYINVVLLEKPFAVSQYQAEKYLKNLLQVSEEELCALPYSVSVPGYVDDSASGVDYRFSFCSDSLLTPNS
jgi:hypothetical protein